MAARMPAQQLVGKVFTSESSDGNGSFNSIWEELLAGDFFQPLDTLTTTPNRSSLVIFSPYGSIMFWIGSLLPLDANVPTGYQQFKLPESKVGQVTEQSRGLVTQLPISLAFDHVLERLEQQKITVPEHLGQTQKPYFVTSYPLNAAGQVETVNYFVYLEDQPTEIFDEYD